MTTTRVAITYENSSYPIISRQVVNDSQEVISSVPISLLEAESLGFNLEEYIYAYKTYVSEYLDSLGTFNEEVALSSRDKHLNLFQLLYYVTQNMEPHWAAEWAANDPVTVDEPEEE